MLNRAPALTALAVAAAVVHLLGVAPPRDPVISDPFYLVALIPPLVIAGVFAPNIPGVTPGRIVVVGAVVAVASAPAVWVQDAEGLASVGWSRLMLVAVLLLLGAAAAARAADRPQRKAGPVANGLVTLAGAVTHRRDGQKQAEIDRLAAEVSSARKTISQARKEATKNADEERGRRAALQEELDAKNLRLLELERMQRALGGKWILGESLPGQGDNAHLGKPAIRLAAHIDTPEVFDHVAKIRPFPANAEQTKRTQSFMRELGVGSAMAGAQRIVPIVDSHVDHDRYEVVLVMPYLPDGDFAVHYDVNRGAARTLREWRDDIREVLLGVAELHDRGWIHRDLKPANILRGAGRLWLTDYEFAKALDGRLSAGSSGALLWWFTEGWGAPEQYRVAVATDNGRTIVREDVTEAADLYAVGAMMYHALTGLAPYEAELRLLEVDRGRPDVSFTLLFAGGLVTGTVAVADASPQVPAELAAWIDRMVALDPERRPQSATAALKELDAIDLGAAADTKFTAWDASARAVAHASGNLVRPAAPVGQAAVTKSLSASDGTQVGTVEFEAGQEEDDVNATRPVPVIPRARRDR